MELGRTRSVPVDALHMISCGGRAVAAIIETARRARRERRRTLPTRFGQRALHPSRSPPEPQSERGAPLPVSGDFHYCSPMNIRHVALPFFSDLKPRLGGPERPGPRGDSTSHFIDHAICWFICSWTSTMRTARPVRAAAAAESRSRRSQMSRSTSRALVECCRLSYVLARSR